MINKIVESQLKDRPTNRHIASALTDCINENKKLENQLKAEREKYKKLEAAYDSLSNSNDLN